VIEAEPGAMVSVGTPPWRLSRTPALSRARPSHYFTTLGLPSLFRLDP